MIGTTSRVKGRGDPGSLGREGLRRGETKWAGRCESVRGDPGPEKALRVCSSDPSGRRVQGAVTSAKATAAPEQTGETRPSAQGAHGGASERARWRPQLPRPAAVSLEPPRTVSDTVRPRHIQGCSS